MAGTVMHLVIADRLLDRLTIANPSLFYNGNLAPDAIMNRKDYTRQMKTHTHFKDGLKPYEFRIKSNQEIYNERLMQFIRQLPDKSDPMYELYLGYVVHIFTDELYLLEYYEKFFRELERQNIPLGDKQFEAKFNADVDRVDWELVRNYRFHYPMPQILLQTERYSIPGWVGEQEIIDSRAFIIKKNFETRHDSEALNVTTFEMNYEFIDLCVERIPDMLELRLQY